MNITNGKIITSSDLPEGLEGLNNFMEKLLNDHAAKNDTEPLPIGTYLSPFTTEQSEEPITAYLIPEGIELKTVINSGCELRSFNGVDIIEKPGTVFTEAKYNFTDEELTSISHQMAEKVQELNQIEDEKKQINSQFKAKIDECKAVMNGLATKNISGYEYREQEAIIVLDFKAKKRYFKSIETGNILKDESLANSDYQLVFNF